MKHVFIIAVILALSAISFGGGELPARAVQQVPVPVQQSLLERTWDASIRYVRNRVNDVRDVGTQTIDAGAGIVASDPAKDDKDSYLSDRACDIGDVGAEAVDAVLGVVGIDVAGDDSR